MKTFGLILLMSAVILPVMMQGQAPAKKPVKVFVPPPKQVKVFVPPTKPAKVFVPPAQFSRKMIAPAETAPQPTSMVPAASTNVSQLNPALFQPKGYSLGRVQEAVPGRSLYRWSMAAVIAANGADAISSWHGQEANPVIGSGQFGYSSIAIKSGFVGSSLLIQHIILRHRPDLYKKLAWLNFGTAGLLGGVAAHNMQIR